MTEESQPPVLGAPGEILGDGVCHYVYGDPVIDGKFSMCGNIAVENKSYCRYHYNRCISALWKAEENKTEPIEDHKNE